MIELLMQPDVIAMLSGIIGMTTGTYSVIRTNQIKKLDLRLEKGKIINTIEINIKSLADLPQQANISKERCYSARGMLNSGAMIKWKQKHSEYVQLAEEYKNNLDLLKNNRNPNSNLENDILKSDNLNREVMVLIEALGASLQEDKEACQELAKTRSKSL